MVGGLQAADNLRSGIAVLAAALVVSTPACSDQSAPVVKSVGYSLPSEGATVEIDPPWPGFEAYNYVAVNGAGPSAMVVLGAADRGRADHSGSISAALSIHENGAAWSALAALPVQYGLANASAVQADGDLYVAGADCPATVEGDGLAGYGAGMSFSCDGGPGVFLRWNAGDNPAGAWESLAAPPLSGGWGSLHSDDQGAVIAVGFSLTQQRHSGEPAARFDPTAGTWTEIEPPAPGAGVCVVAGELLSVRMVGGSVELWRSDNGSWIQDDRARFSEPLRAVGCARTGLVGYGSMQLDDGSAGTAQHSVQLFWQPFDVDVDVDVDEPAKAVASYAGSSGPLPADGGPVENAAMLRRLQHPATSSGRTDRWFVPSAGRALDLEEPMVAAWQLHEHDQLILGVGPTTKERPNTIVVWNPRR